jgi:hypothetical protein
MRFALLKPAEQFAEMPMDAEIRKAIDAVRADLRGLEARLRADLHAEISSLESKLRQAEKGEVLSLRAAGEK